MEHSSLSELLDTAEQALDTFALADNPTPEDEAEFRDMADEMLDMITDLTEAFNIAIEEVLGETDAERAVRLQFWSEDDEDDEDEEDDDGDGWKGDGVDLAADDPLYTWKDARMKMRRTLTTTSTIFPEHTFPPSASSSARSGHMPRSSLMIFFSIPFRIWRS